jgi:hypothetical protein
MTWEKLKIFSHRIILYSSGGQCPAQNRDNFRGKQTCTSLRTQAAGPVKYRQDKPKE